VRSRERETEETEKTEKSWDRGSYQEKKHPKDKGEGSKEMGKILTGM